MDLLTRLEAKSDFASDVCPALRRREAKARNEGEAKGMAMSILRVLGTRSIVVSPEQRQEILGCADLDRLDHWVGRAALAASADEFLQG